MKALPNEARTKNVSERAHCRWCGDVGYVEVELRTVGSAWTKTRKRPNADGTMPHDAVFEQLAPCPWCEAGYREEFPVPKADNKRPTTPPWKDGYWQGRDAIDMEPMYPKGFAELPLEENARRMRELMEKHGGKLVRDMPS